MPWDIKWKSGKLLVILTAVHWNILNGGVIVFLISSAWVCVYLFTCSVNKDSVCCDPLFSLPLHHPHHPTPYPIEDEKSLWAPGAAAELPPLEKGEHYCSLSRRFKDTFSPARRMDPYSLWASRWAHVKTLSPPCLGSCCESNTNGSVDWLGWTYGISVWTQNHTFSVCCYGVICQ